MSAQTRAVARAALFGLLSWVIPFVVSFGLFPLKKTNAALFSTLMYLVVLVIAGALLMAVFQICFPLLASRQSTISVES